MDARIEQEGLVLALNAAAVAAAYVADDLLFDDEEDTIWEKVTVFVDEYVRMGDPAFRMHFRLTREQCEILYQELSTHLRDQGVVVELPQPRGHPFTHQLLMVLWIMATQDSFRSVALRFGVFKSHVHRYYLKIITALREMAPQFIKWPNREERYQIKTFIQGYSDFPGVIGMIDVRHFKLPKPAHEPAAFRNHHHSYSIKAQAVCDHRLLVRDLYVGEAGSLHDARVFRRSPLCRSILFNDDMMEEDEHIVGDSAYTLLNRVIKPFENDGHLTPLQKNYNDLHSRSRMAIERTFGKLTVVWRRDYFLPSYKFDYAVDHIVASFVLHNFRIIHGSHYPLNLADDEELDDLEMHRPLINRQLDEDVAVEDIIDDEFVPQGNGAERLARAHLLGEQKRWRICNALPLVREE